MGRIFSPNGLLFGPAGIATDRSCCCGGCTWNVSEPGADCTLLSADCFGGVTPLKIAVTLALTGTPYVCPDCYFGCNTGAVCMVGADQTAFNGTWTLTQDPSNPCLWTYADDNGPLVVNYYPGSFDCSTTPTAYRRVVMTLDLLAGTFIVSVPIAGNDHYIFYVGGLPGTCDPATCTFGGVGTYPFFCLTTQGTATFTGT